MFKDYFSAQADRYAAYRPTYPAALFSFIATHAPARQLAWDCATGSGQAALGLAQCFDRVVATDASAAQIDNAQRHPGIEYRVEDAHAVSLADAEMDAIVVAQALHWFDLPRFFAETDRVLKPGGILAVASYCRLEISPTIDAIIQDFYDNVIGPFWPPERALVEEEYRSVSLPFPELATPDFDMRTQWSLQQLLGYFGSWSAVQRYKEHHGRNPLEAITIELSKEWGPISDVKTVNWPLSVRICRRN